MRCCHSDKIFINGCIGTSNAASDGNFIKIKTFLFQWITVFMKIIGHIRHFRWLGPNVWCETWKIWIQYIKPIYRTNVWWIMKVFQVHWNDPLPVHHWNHCGCLVITWVSSIFKYFQLFIILIIPADQITSFFSLKFVPQGPIDNESAWFQAKAWHWTSNNHPALTHLSLDKMAAISQTVFSNAFTWMKMYELRLKFHWSLFLRVQMGITQHWFR